MDGIDDRSLVTLFPADLYPEPGEAARKYSSDQLRDDHGRFADEGGAGPADQHTVGITTAREGRGSMEVFHEAQKFRDDLAKIPGVRDVRVGPAVGASGSWGSEPSWNVQYRGNGQARALVQQVAAGEVFGLQTKQDAAIFLSGGCRASCVPVKEFHFSKLGSAGRARVDKLLTDHGFGGWTIYNLPGGGKAYRLVHVPDWSGQSTPDFLKSYHAVYDALRQSGAPLSGTRSTVAKLELLTKENNYGRP